MSEYIVKSSLGEKEWQIKNCARDHQLICDDLQHNAGPNPVEYLCASINSCITMSAGMIIKSRKLDVKNFHLETKATTKNLGHAKSVVDTIKVNVFFDSQMTNDEKEDFLSFILHVSTVYQSVKDSINIEVKLVDD